MLEVCGGDLACCCPGSSICRTQPASHTPALRAPSLCLTDYPVETPQHYRGTPRPCLVRMPRSVRVVKIQYSVFSIQSWRRTTQPWTEGTGGERGRCEAPRSREAPRVRGSLSNWPGSSTQLLASKGPQQHKGYNNTKFNSIQPGTERAQGQCAFGVLHDFE